MVPFNLKVLALNLTSARIISRSHFSIARMLGSSLQFAIWKSFGKHARTMKSINTSGNMFPCFSDVVLKLTRVRVLRERHPQRQRVT